MILLTLIVFGCQTDKAPQTELVVSNTGTTDFVNLWFSIDGSKLVIDSLKPGEHRTFHIDAIGNKRINYGFNGDESLREKMGGELFFYGNQMPMKSSTLEVGLDNGLIRSIVAKPEQGNH